MNMKNLLNDFSDHVGKMSDDDIVKSIEKAKEHCSNVDEELIEEFIKFAKAEYGLTVEAVKSDTPDSFKKIFELIGTDVIKNDD